MNSRESSGSRRHSGARGYSVTVGKKGKDDMTAATMNPAFLREAIRLAVEKMEGNEGGPFGAVIVRDKQIIGRGWNRVTSTNDPTAHAEILAIRDACSKRKTFSLAGCEIYSSCEPCPMCLAA